METPKDAESTMEREEDSEPNTDCISVSQMEIDGKESDEVSSHQVNEVASDKKLAELKDAMIPSGSDSGCSPNSSPPRSHLNFEMPHNPIKKANPEIDLLNLPNSKDAIYTADVKLETAGESTSDHVDEKKDTETSNNSIIYFVNQDAKITPYHTIQYILDQEQPFDTVISCADGKIGAHRLVLVSASPFIGDMFCGHNHRLGEVAVLILPDVKVSVMKVLLRFCYTGSMFFPIEDQKEVLQTMKLLLLGEFGDIDMKEVTVKAEPAASTSAAAIASEDPHFPDSEPRISRSLEELPGPSSSTVDSKEDLLTTSASEEKDDSDDETSSSDDSDSDDINNPERYQTMPVSSNSDPAQERLAFANNFLRLVQTDSKEAKIKYLIGMKQNGCKTKKIQCYLCPGAFKTMDTLTTHLEDKHAEFLESRNLRKSEFETLTHCSYCDKKYKDISSANLCISKHSRSRCLICLKIIRVKEFKDHIKTNHIEERRNDICVVKCRWCDAGLLLHEPIDNKAISAHCFSAHFHGKNGTASYDFEKEVVKKKSEPEVRKKEVLPGPAPKATDSLSHVSAEVDSKVVAGTPKHESKVSKNSKPTGKTGKEESSTPKASASKVTMKEVPAVLALLQRASQKRKNNQEAESESTDFQNKHPTKRPRLDANGKRLQVAKRTGKPIGRQVDLNSLKTGIPSLTSSKKPREKTKSVLADLTKLTNIFVQLQYSKNFVRDCFCPSTGESLGDKINPDSSKSPNQSSHSTSSLESDAPTEEIVSVTLDAKRRLSDSRCSMPLP